MWAVYLRSDLGQDYVNHAANNVVAPRLIERTKRLLRQLRDAVLGARILLVGTSACLLDAGTQLLRSAVLDERVSEIDSICGVGPCL